MFPEIATARMWCTFKAPDIDDRDAPLDLCRECSSYLDRNEDHPPDDWTCCWPGYMWKLLTDDAVLGSIGVDAWKLVCEAWRHWWWHSLPELCDRYQDRSALDARAPYFKDVTQERNRILKMRKELKLGDIKKISDELLFPTVLCPWTCTEYFHKVGCLQFDAVLATFCHDAEIPTTSAGQKKTLYCETAKRDFFRDHYDCHINNPKWTAWPSVAFVEGRGLVFLTCSDHNGGTKEKYFFAPRLPHCLPAPCSDQVAPAVIQARTIKPMKARTYNTTYQLNEQRGCFAGIDTCSIRSHGNYSFQSHLLATKEALAYSGRADIRGLVGRLVESGKMPSEFAENMINLSKTMYPPDSVYLQGLKYASTFMAYEDCIKLQRSLSEVHEIEVIKVGAAATANGAPAVSVFSPSWPRFIMQIHSHDSYGERFGSLFDSWVPARGQRRAQDCRLVWVMSALFTSVPSLYESFESSVQRSTDWSGYFLTFLSKSVLPGSTKPKDNDLFRNARKWTPMKCQLECFAKAVAAPNTHVEIRNGNYDVSQVVELFGSVSNDGNIALVNHTGRNLEASIMTMVDGKLLVGRGWVSAPMQLKTERVKALCCRTSQHCTWRW